MARNPYHQALAAFGPDVEIIVRLARLVRLEDHRQVLVTLKDAAKRGTGRDCPIWRVADMWDLAMVEMEIATLRRELIELGYDVDATTRRTAALPPEA